MEIRQLGAGHVDAIFEIRKEAYRVGESARDRHREVCRPHEFVGAFIDGELVGILAVFPLGQFFGGRSVPMGAIGSVAVRPAARGQGIAPRLLREALDVMHAQGLAISMLHPATTRVYRRSGWEIAVEQTMWSVPTTALATLPEGGLRMRRGSEADLPRLRECYTPVATATNGFVDRSDDFWTRQIDLTHEHAYLYVVELEGSISGYVQYRQEKERGNLWGFGIRVKELIAVDAPSALTLWRGLASHSAQVDRVRFFGPPDSLMLMLPEQALRLEFRNASMSRVVDAPAAIAARGYPPGLTAHVEFGLHDERAPWNDGNWVLDVANGRGELTKGGNGDVELDANAFATLYTGFATTATLRMTGRLRGDAHPAAALDAIFNGPRPWSVDEF